MGMMPGMRGTAIPARAARTTHIFHHYTIRVRERDALGARLREAGIGFGVYYPVPLHMQQCFAYLGYRPEDCPESARAARETVHVQIGVGREVGDGQVLFFRIVHGEGDVVVIGEHVGGCPEQKILRPAADAVPDRAVVLDPEVL